MRYELSVVFEQISQPLSETYKRGYVCKSALYTCVVSVLSQRTLVALLWITLYVKHNATDICNYCTVLYNLSSLQKL